jgi:autoinducer 2 (AI-2) kinase
MQQLFSVIKMINDEKTNCFLALDAGIGGGRCVIADAEGNLLSTSYSEWDYYYPDIPGACEFDADQFWSILVKQIRNALSDARIDASRIKGISSTAQRETSIFFNCDREILSLPCGDGRVQSDISQFQGDFREKVKKITGRYPSSLGALFRLWWLRKYQPDIFNKITNVLTMNDWMLYRLSGKFSAEPSNASHTFVFDIHNRRWSRELLDDLNLPSDIWPEIHDSGTQIGEVTEKAEKETGLKKGTPVISGGADAQCGTIGSAANREGALTVNAGTTSPIQLVINHPIISQKANTNCHVVPGEWILESNAGLTGYIIRHWANLLLSSEQTADLSIYDILDSEAEKVSPGSEGLFSFLASSRPGMRFGSGCIIDTKPRGSPPRPKTKSELWRSIRENVCFAIRAHIENLQEISGINIPQLRICGGQAKSNFYLQMQADVIGKQVLVPKIKEAASFGAIICASVGSGLYTNFQDAADKMVKIESVIEPNESNHKKYNDIFEHWKSIPEKLADL